MSTSFWAIKAAKNKKNEVVPGTSKWVANELYNMNSEVLTHTEMFYHEFCKDIYQLNDFMEKALAGQDDRLFVESITEERNSENKSDAQMHRDEKNPAVEETDYEQVAGASEKQEQEDTSSNFTYISPKNQGKRVLIGGDAEENAEIPQSSPLNLSNTNATTKYTPKTPSPLKNDQGEHASTSPGADLSFIPIANTINPNKAIPSKLQSPYNERESSKFASGDDSFQAISTAIRKSIAGKSGINNPRTSQFIHVDNTPNKIRKRSLDNILRANTRATIGSLSNRNLNDSGTSVPLKQESVFTRKSTSKTPKRASVFVSLPSREPITISSSSNLSNSISDVKSRSLKVFEKLEIASKNDNKNITYQSPTALKRRPLKRETDNYSGINSTYIKESLKRRSSARQLIIDSSKLKEESNKGSLKQENNDGKLYQKQEDKQVNKNFDNFKDLNLQIELKSDKIQTATKIPVLNAMASSTTSDSLDHGSTHVTRNAPSPEEEKKLEIDKKSKDNHTHTSPTKSPVINSIGSVLRRARNVFMSNPKSVGFQYGLESSSRNTGSPNRAIQISKSTSNVPMGKITWERSKSPIRSSISSAQPSRSPTKLISLEASEPNSRTSSRIQNIDSELKISIEPKIIQSKAEVDLINRLMAPTSASAAKTVKTPSRKAPEKKADTIQSSKNRFLTTTLHPGKPQFNPIKAPNKSNMSPSKKLIPLNDESERRESKISSKLEFLNIPSLKKKSLMAERSEAAAQKPKQKIMIAMNHKLDSKLQPNPSPALKTEGPRIESINDTSKKRLSNNLNDVSDGQQNTKTRIKSTYGSLTTLPESSKREESNGSEVREYAKRHKTENKTPSRQPSRSKQKILEKKASRISNSGKKTSHRNANFKTNDIFNDPKTPASDRKIQTLDDTLPDIPTDDEDTKSHKVLQSWAETPQLHKIVMQNRSIDPVTIFGEVPSLNIEEIFESQASRYRGKSSPSNFTPDEKQHKREAADYAMKMGYKNSAL